MNGTDSFSKLSLIHIYAFNDPLIDNKDSKKRYRADVLIEDQLAKYDDKINKEVAKAAKKFGDSFDEAQFRSTNGRVLEHQAKRDALHTRFSKALNDNCLLYTSPFTPYQEYFNRSVAPSSIKQ